jgi:hypothetical protein
VAACERSLERLATARLHLYLLQSCGEHPLQDTVACRVRAAARGPSPPEPCTRQATCRTTLPQPWPESSRRCASAA